MRCATVTGLGETRRGGKWIGDVGRERGGWIVGHDGAAVQRPLQQRMRASSTCASCCPHALLASGLHHHSPLLLSHHLLVSHIFIFLPPPGFLLAHLTQPRLHQIPATSLPTFTAAYGALLKASMAPHMRKRDKKKERARADAADKRRKELYVDVLVGNDGKRGAGRRKRQRKIAAQKKKEAERERIEVREAARAAAPKDE